jgi:hypothetical protein
MDSASRAVAIRQPSGPQIEGITFTATSAVIDKSISEEDFSAALKQVLGMSVCIQWWIGDMLAFGYKTYEELTAQLEGEYKRTLRSLQQYRYVCAAISPSRRLEDLSFGHHEPVAPLPASEQRKWLRLAVKENLSVAQFRKVVPKKSASPKTEETLTTETAATTVRQGDCLELMRQMEAGSIDLVFGSPPYEDARTYGIDYALTGDVWVDWMFERVQESLRVCKGLVAFVVQGRTKQYQWSATPVLLMAKLHQTGICLREPVIYKRHGIPGSGGPDWLRRDYEFVICCTNGGKLPWHDNTACGTEPKWGNEGGHKPRMQDGSFGESDYQAPEIVNPGNVIECIAGGGTMGSKLCHDNEAPFPEKLAEFFIRSFCPVGGTVLDPFCGSGTTLAVAKQYGRQGIGIDIRQSQVDLAKRRIANESTRLVIA